MKVIQRGLTKQDITSYKRYDRWSLRKEDNKEILLMIDEQKRNKDNEIVNIVNYKEGFALLCIDDINYCRDFYAKNKEYTPRLFIKNNSASKYNEYAITTWSSTSEGIYVKLK